MIIEYLAIFLEMFAIALVNNYAMGLRGKEGFTVSTWFYIGASAAYVELFNVIKRYSALALFVHAFSFCYCLLRKKDICLSMFATTCGIVLLTLF